MKKRSLIFRSLASISLIFVLSASIFADTIRLKDGSIIKGKITGFSGGNFTVVIGEGSRRREMTFAAADVESIMFDSEPTLGSGDTVPTKSVNVPSSQPKAPQVVISDNTTSRPPVETKKSDTPAVKRQEPTVTPPVRQVSGIRPIEVNVKVLADNTNNGWTNSGWVVKKGQKIRITATGQISLGRGKSSSPSGIYELEDNAKLLKSVPTGALLAVIGDDNNDFIYIGSSREFVAERDGALFLGVNEGDLNDNSGSFEVKIEIIPDGE